MKQGKSNAKGNLFENKTAKQLGQWMFDNPNMLIRSTTSGAKKTAYLGDIVPAMQMPWTTWPFNVETKHGYENQIADLSNQKTTREWLGKVIAERGDQELIIYLIIKFHRRKTILLTDLPFSNVTAPIILNHAHGTGYLPFHLYNFEELLTCDFYSLYDNNEKLKTEIFKRGI